MCHSKQQDPLHVQLGACINAVRENPDAFACQYPCNYSAWRNDVLVPSRGGLVATGSPGSTDLQTSVYSFLMLQEL